MLVIIAGAIITRILINVGQELFFFFQAEDGIRDLTVTGVQTCALPICAPPTNEDGRRLASTGFDEGRSERASAPRCGRRLAGPDPVATIADEAAPRPLG